MLPKYYHDASCNDVNIALSISDGCRVTSTLHDRTISMIVGKLAWPDRTISMIVGTFGLPNQTFSMVVGNTHTAQLDDVIVVGYIRDEQPDVV